MVSPSGSPIAAEKLRDHCMTSGTDWSLISGAKFVKVPPSIIHCDSSYLMLFERHCKRLRIWPTKNLETKSSTAYEKDGVPSKSTALAIAAPKVSARARWYRRF